MYWICLKWGYTCTLMPPVNVVRSGADSLVVVGGYEWTYHFDRLPCGVQALPGSQGEDLPSCQNSLGDPCWPVYVCSQGGRLMEREGPASPCLFQESLELSCKPLPPRSPAHFFRVNKTALCPLLRPPPRTQCLYYPVDPFRQSSYLLDVLLEHLGFPLIMMMVII